MLESRAPQLHTEPSDWDEHPGHVLRNVLDSMGRRLTELGITDPNDMRLQTLLHFRDQAQQIQPDDRFRLQRLLTEAQAFERQINTPHVVVPRDKR